MLIAAAIATSLLFLLCIFQTALALGAPYGHFAWGGQHRVLPPGYRIGSLVSIVIYAFIAACITSGSGLWAIIPRGLALDTCLWVIFAYLCLGVIMNALSRSKLERNTMTPVALILAVCVYIIALN